MIANFNLLDFSLNLGSLDKVVQDWLSQKVIVGFGYKYLKFASNYMSQKASNNNIMLGVFSLL